MQAGFKGLSFVYVGSSTFWMGGLFIFFFFAWVVVVICCILCHCYRRRQSLYYASVEFYSQIPNVWANAYSVSKEASKQTLNYLD